MTTSSAATPPLASFVLRVTGQPATLRYELHNLRTGQRHHFRRVEALSAFLREQGLPEWVGSGRDDDPDQGPPSNQVP